MRMGGKGGRRTGRRNINNPIVKRRSKFLEPGDVVDIDDIDLLRRFVTEFGKIVPARLSGVTARQQRQIRKGVGRARNMGLLA